MKLKNRVNLKSKYIFCNVFYVYNISYDWLIPGISMLLSDSSGIAIVEECGGSFKKL